MFLSNHELVALTGHHRADAQTRALKMMGIEHRQRPDGKVIVLRSAVEMLLGGIPTIKAAKDSAPDWEAI